MEGKNHKDEKVIYYSNTFKEKNLEQLSLRNKGKKPWCTSKEGVIKGASKELFSNLCEVKPFEAEDSLLRKGKKKKGMVLRGDISSIKWTELSFSRWNTLTSVVVVEGKQ